MESEQKEVYSMDQHRLRYAGWAVSRAIGRGLKGASHICVLDVIGMARVEECLNEQIFQSRQDYDNWHPSIVLAIVKASKKANMEMYYGRAAKALAIYIKTLYIIPGKRKDLIQYAHPPIDSIVLKKCLPREWQRDKRNMVFTKFDKNRYQTVYKYLESKKIGPMDPRWMIEACWPLVQSGSKKTATKPPRSK